MEWFGDDLRRSVTDHITFGARELHLWVFCGNFPCMVLADDTFSAAAKMTEVQDFIYIYTQLWIITLLFVSCSTDYSNRLVSVLSIFW